MVIIVLFIIIVVVFVDYKFFINRRKNEINSFHTVETSFGEVSYIDINSNKKEVILFCTGGGVGFDSPLSFEWLKNTDFRIICVNRPGYCKLPLEDSFEKHIDIYHQVLDSLDIKEVYVFGISMGGVSALLYTQKYGAKKLLLWSAITNRYLPNPESTNSILGKLVMKNSIKDIVSYLLMRSVQIMPITTSVEFFFASTNVSKSLLKSQVVLMMKNKETKMEFQNFVKTMSPMSYMYNGMMKEVEMAQYLNIDLSKIETPCFAIHSSLDKDVPISHLEYLEKNLSNIKTIRTQGMGHYVWWGDKSDIIKNESISFLAK